MQKQEKKSKYIKYSKKNLSKKLIRLRKLYSKSTYSFNIYFKKTLTFFKTKNRYKKIYIRFTQNNIFCTLTNYKHQTILTSSSGKYKIKTSKKKMKFSSKIILKSFLKEIRNKVFKNKILINIIAPKNLRKKIIGQLCQTLKNENIFIDVNDKKSFNGCRPKKQKRKKRKGLRILK
jgi:ribosomal protein S11